MGCGRGARRGRDAGRGGIALAALCLLAACAIRGEGPAGGRAAAAGRPPHIRALHTDLDVLLASPALRHGTVAVAVESLARGDILFRCNADRRLVPASNMKIVTLAAAAERLGWGHTFSTLVFATGPIADGIVHGDLVVRGTGDPTINTRDSASERVFTRWASTLAGHGIRRIEGRIIGDDNALEDETFGEGWAWDDLPYGYAAQGGGLQVNEAAVMLGIAPGPAPGAAAVLDLQTPDGLLVLDNDTVTVAGGEAAALQVHRLPGSRTVRVTGTVPLGLAPFTRLVSVDNPTEHFARVLASAMERHGIIVAGGVADIDDLPAGTVPPSGPPLLSHQSPPLRQIAAVLMKDSQNVYAETVLRVIGATGGKPATAAAGREVVRSLLQVWGVGPDSIAIADGSGLSSGNVVTADALMTILRRMYEEPRHHAPWLAAMPAGGTDGTLKKRFVGSPASGRVRAKTGSLRHARALSGYVSTLDDEPLVFSVIVNNAAGTGREVEAAIDRMVERLVAFSR